jgi:hypothetical protein
MIQFGPRSKHIPSLFKSQLFNAMHGKIADMGTIQNTKMQFVGTA